MLMPSANERNTAADKVRVIGGRPRPFALGARSDKTGTRSLADHRRLELRKDSEHLEQGTTRWRRGVESLLM
jgi:hypothetical protein